MCHVSAGCLITVMKNTRKAAHCQQTPLPPEYLLFYTVLYTHNTALVRRLDQIILCIHLYNRRGAVVDAVNVAGRSRLSHSDENIFVL